ncbi:GNAT family acetyltransferase Bsu1853 (YoaA) [Lachnospiraceae bacterium KM106-2]|nr:GNAT family acetyltransferase Bsu1853 (YoaA) [Lachnospiraceae bacterium KM106-2]
MFFKNLDTKRLILKNIGQEDAEFILRQFSNDEVNRYLFDEEPYTTIEEAEKLIQFYTEEEPRYQHRWVLVRKDTGEKMGTCGFHCWNRESQECEMGYDLYPDYQNHGYMQEALAAILDFAKTEMHVRRIEVHIAEDNIKSHNTAKRQGFVDSQQTYNEVFRGKEYLHHIYVLNWTN